MLKASFGFNPNYGRQPLTVFGKSDQTAIRRPTINGPDLVNKPLIFDVKKRKKIIETRVNPTKKIGGVAHFCGGIANPKVYRIGAGNIVCRIGSQQYKWGSWVMDVSTVAELIYQIHSDPKGEKLLEKWVAAMAMGGTYSVAELAVRFFRLKKPVGVFTGLGNPTGLDWKPSSTPEIVPDPIFLQTYIPGAHPDDGGGSSLVSDLKDNAEQVDEIPLDRAASLVGSKVLKYSKKFADL